MDTAGYKQQDGHGEVEEYSQQITFLVDTEEYGVEALRVQEIIRYLTPVKVPNAPDSIQGVINFRGEVIPVLDLRKALGLSPLQVDPYTVIVVIEIESKIFGIVVDRVLDLVDIPLSKINDGPGGNSQANRKYLKAMVKMEGRLILILDLEKIITFEEIGVPEK